MGAERCLGSEAHSAHGEHALKRAPIRDQNASRANGPPWALSCRYVRVSEFGFGRRYGELVINQRLALGSCTPLPDPPPTKPSFPSFCPKAGSTQLDSRWKRNHFLRIAIVMPPSGAAHWPAPLPFFSFVFDSFFYWEGKEQRQGADSGCTERHLRGGL